MKDRKILFTAFAIFLLMGAAPLQAARVHGAEEAVQQHAIGNQESANAALQGKFGPFGGSCETTQENFVRLNNEANGPLTALQNGEQLSFAGKVALAMKVRGMLRAARRAASNDCAWLGDNSVMNFQERLGEIAQMSPCAETAREMIEEANECEDEEEHEEAVREALSVLMSPTCEVEDDEDEEEEEEIVEESVEAIDEGDYGDELSEVSEENTQEEDEILEEIDELSDELTEEALTDPTGASLLQENDGQVETVIAGAFIALFFGLFFLLWLPFIAGAACFLTGLGFLVFSMVGCLLYNLLRLIMGRVPGGCPMFNWLPACPQVFAVTIRSIWGDNVRVGGGYNSAYYNNGYGYNNYGPGYVAPVTTGVYYDRRRRWIGGGGAWRPNRRANRRVQRANRRARRANRRANRANRRARRANRRARRMGRRMGRR